MHRRPVPHRSNFTALPRDADAHRLPARPRPSAGTATLLWLQALRRHLWRWQRLAAPRRGTATRVWC